MLGVGAFVLGWYLSRPVLGAVAGLLGVGAGPMLVAVLASFFAERTFLMTVSLLGYTVLVVVSATVSFGACRVVEQGNKVAGSGV